MKISRQINVGMKISLEIRNVLTCEMEVIARKLEEQECKKQTF